jgi:hypothetical protein
MESPTGVQGLVSGVLKAFVIWNLKSLSIFPMLSMDFKEVL